MVGQSNPAHLFFSYAHADEKQLIPIHAQMQNVLERNLWIDKVGLDRGIAWENAIKAAIDDSYGVIFAVTEAFVASKFIREKEITWTLARFKDKQGAQIFPILFDDVEVPEDLKTPFITHLIDARDGDMARVYAELKRVLPEAKGGMQPFVVSWPRLTNFKGRDRQLIDLHKKLMDEGHSGVKISGLYGMGGIGKTQLAVEYAHRYRYHYPGGVYWLNAGADWQKEVAACAVNLDRSLVDKKDEEKALAFRDFLAARDNEALLVLDNVEDPVEVTRREIAPKLTLFDLRRQTKARLLLTTRVQTMPAGFESVSVNVLDKTDARAVLLEAWADDKRKDTADVETLDKIAFLLGYLPLALGWIEAALQQLPDTTPAELLDELKARGLDDLIQELQDGNIDIGTPAYHDRLVGSVLDWQIKQLKSVDAPTLLALTAAFGEAAVVPLERLRLMMGLPEKGLIKPFAKAVKDVQAYSLVETLNEGTAFRLHPLTQAYVAKHYNAAERLAEAVPRLVAAYRNPATLDDQTRARGFAAVMEDLRITQALSTSDELDALTRLFTLEEPHLLVLPKGMQQGYVIQQLRERAHHEGDEGLKTDCDTWLRGKSHLHHDEMRYPTSKALRRTLSGHTDDVTGALELKDGNILSWSADHTLRVWSADGQYLNIFEGHTDNVIGALELKDGRILSWSNPEIPFDVTDTSLRLWSIKGEPPIVMSGHTDHVNGALELNDGRILSWARDKTLRLWSKEGKIVAVMKGHKYSISGALELSDGHILSWGEDKTLRLWSLQGEAKVVMKGHNKSITGALELSDGHILSWGGDKTLRLWSLQGELIEILKGHTGWVTGALELSDGRILSWAGDPIMDKDPMLRIWSGKGESLMEMIGHSSSISGALELKDGSILSWSYDETIRVWSAEGKPLTMLGHNVTGALELSDGYILSWAADKTLRLWLIEGNHDSDIAERTDKVIGLLELKNGHLLSWTGNPFLKLDFMLRLWSQEGKLLATFSHNVSGVIELTDGRILSWAHDETMQLWSNQCNPLSLLTGHSKMVTGALELRDGRILSWSYDTTLMLWLPTGEPLCVLRGHTDWVTGALELRDGRILSWSYDKMLRIWSPQGEPFKVLEGHTDYVTDALELKDGSILSWSSDLFMGNDSTLRVWSSTGEAILVLDGHKTNVQGAVELNDGRVLSWTYEPTLRVWSPESKIARVLEGHISDVDGALELSDGRILSWSSDKTLRLWSQKGETIKVLEGHTDSVTDALELNNKYILSRARDWTIRLWNYKGDSLLVYASDFPITCCIGAKDGRIIVGDEGGRVLFLKLED